MVGPAIPLAMLGEKGLKEVYNIGARPIIGFKNVKMKRNGSYKETSVQVNAWQILGATLLGGIALAFYVGATSDKTKSGLPWPLSEFINAIKIQDQAISTTGAGWGAGTGPKSSPPPKTPTSPPPGGGPEPFPILKWLGFR